MARQWDFESASGDSAADRMRVLWCPVLNQAISDAFGDIRRCVAKSEVDRARAFCLAESGKWAREREEVCALAGIDPDAFREKVKALSEAGKLARRVST
jgi:hypothetical protein